MANIGRHSDPVLLRLGSLSGNELSRGIPGYIRHQLGPQPPYGASPDLLLAAPIPRQGSIDFRTAIAEQVRRQSFGLRRGAWLAEIRIECDVLPGLVQGKIDAVSTFVAQGKFAVRGDGHIVGIRVVVGMHDAIDARGGNLLAGPEGVRAHMVLPFRPLRVVPA